MSELMQEQTLMNCPLCKGTFSWISINKNSTMEKSQKDNIVYKNEQKVRELEEKLLLIEEREKNALKKMQEENHFRLLEREKMIKDMELKLMQAQHIALSGSQQKQGEVVEEDFSRRLRAAFPQDEWIDIAKGVEGGDLLQLIPKAGKVLWEFKNTKSFQVAWISKLATDVSRSKAELGIIVSKTLAKDASEIEYYNGIYVVSFSLALTFAHLVRKNLLDLAFAKASGENQEEKVSQLYQYITSNSFKQKMSRIAQTFRSQKEILEKEKRAIQKSWAQREKELELALEALSVLYGDMLAISGRAMPSLNELELSDD